VSLLRALSRDLAAVVGRAGVLTEPEDLLPYESDALPFQRFAPGMVVFPESADQVAAVVRLLARSKVPFLARGSGTSLSGSSVPVEGAVIICLARMNRILEVDLLNRLAVVEGGCVNKVVSDAVCSSSWQFAPDPSSQNVCTIAGNIAHNAGGPHTLKYGVTSNHVLAIEMVLPDGEIIQVGSVCEAAPGYDLRGVVIGSEGTTGIVTKATLRLTRVPQGVRTLLAVFDSIDSAAQAANAIIGAGIMPGALEMIDNLMLRAFEAKYHVGLPVDAAAVVVVELQGLEAALDEDRERAVAILRQHRASEVRIAKDEAERQALWKVRKSAGGALGRFTPSYYTLDGCVPRSRMPQAMRTIVAIGAKYGIPVGNAFHAGDGNLHPALLYDDRDPEQRERVLQAAHEMLAACVALDGTISGEHGVGIEKLSLMPQMFTRQDIAAMRAVRRAFDPDERCNPGKVFPAEGDVVLVPPAPPPPETPGPSQIQSAAAGIVGRAHVAASPDGKQPVVYPGSMGQVAQVLEWAHRNRVIVTPLGAGTALPVEQREREGSIALSVARLNAVVHYQPADMTITAQAGITIAALQQVLAQSGQFLPLDPPFDDRATLGGVIAANSAGPLRCGFATVREQLTQVRAALAGGALIRSGAPVVKNAAGFRLCSLFVGSLGTLGVVVEATLRALPLPETEAAVVASFADAARASQAAVRLHCSDAEVCCLELLSPALATGEALASMVGKHCLVAGFIGSRRAVAWSIERARALLSGEGGERVEMLPAAGLRQRLAEMHSPQSWSRISCRVSLPPASLGTFLWQAENVARASALRYTCHAGNGIADLHIAEEMPEAHAVSLLESLRSAAQARGGYLFLTRAPSWLAQRFDPWGACPSGSEVTRRIKHSLDPNNIMNPGTLCGGL